MCKALSSLQSAWLLALVSGGGLTGPCLQAMHDAQVPAPPLSSPLWALWQAHGTSVTVASAVVLTGLFSVRRWRSDRQQYQALLQELTPLAGRLQAQSQQAQTTITQLATSVGDTSSSGAESLTGQSQALAVTARALQGAASDLQQQLDEQSQLIQALLGQAQATQALARGLQSALTADRQAYQQQFGALAAAQAAGLAPVTQQIQALQKTTTTLAAGLTVTATLAQANDQRQTKLTAQLVALQQDLKQLNQRLMIKTPRATVGRRPVNLAQAPLLSAALNYTGRVGVVGDKKLALL